MGITLVIKNMDEMTDTFPLFSVKVCIKIDMKSVINNGV